MVIRTASHRSRLRRFRFDGRDRMHFAACRYASKTANSFLRESEMSCSATRCTE